jgi:hypothetical protein
MSEDVHLLPSEALSRKVHLEIADLTQALVDVCDEFRAGLRAIADAMDVTMRKPEDTPALAKVRRRAAEPPAGDQVAQIRESMEAARFAGAKSLKYPEQLPRNDGSHPQPVFDEFPEVQRQEFLNAQGPRFSQVAHHAALANNPANLAKLNAERQAYEDARAADRRRAGLGGRS